MSTISQKEAIYNAVVSTLAERGVIHEDGAKVVLNTNEKKTIMCIMCAATMFGDVTVKSEKANTNLPKYWSGTLSNYLRKDIRINGGSPYKAKTQSQESSTDNKGLKNLFTKMSSFFFTDSIVLYNRDNK